MTAQAGQAWFFNAMTFSQFKTWNCKRFENICLKNEGFRIFEIAVLRNPSNNVTKTDPGRLHKLDKLDYSMPWHLVNSKLENAKDLKPLPSKIKILAFQKLQT